GRLADDIPPVRLGVRRVVDADFAPLRKPVEQVIEGGHGEPLALTPCRGVVRGEISRRLLCPGTRAAIVPDIYPKGPVSEPRDIPLDLPRNEGLAAGRKTNHYERQR